MGDTRQALLVWASRALRRVAERVPILADIMTTWTERLGTTKLRTFTDADNYFWLEQNPTKKSKWGKLARQGNAMAWEFAGSKGKYTGRLLIDGEIYTSAEATKKFLKG